jgi:hypothetical protein
MARIGVQEGPYRTHTLVLIFRNIRKITRKKATYNTKKELKY